ncbi:protein WEAK CHLOROPLAST MOVEMENT UNDER BLUE LIGHT 1 [Carex littledalei]|uniref:Protein WEAK CHLOROPLAST MOVEMENT UNDER BLUE LIGHT 1 n=1 Tax=Carex littledalei TaxID=544730 RepID=A0A833VHI0_9POAL|nr:protein WEAK CHLOROPLAST MOVEMENT UNDER BLUE LIGHT 1 [Carex littledalei]
MEQPSSEEENHSNEPSETTAVSPTISIEQNDDANEKELSPNHRRGTTLDFHDLSSINTKPEKLYRSQSLSVMRRSLDGLSEDREITEFPKGTDGKPVRPRVRVNGNHERQVTNSRGYVETQTRLESVKSVVSKFGGSVDWSSQKTNSLHKTQNQPGNVTRMVMQEVDKVRREISQYKMKSETIEVSRAELLKELDTTKRRMDGLKANLDKAEAEETKVKEELNRAKHYMEIAEIFAQDGGKDKNLNMVKTQQEAAVSELNSVKEEIKSLKDECTTLAKEKETLVDKAKEAVLASKKAEKMVDELTEELANARKSLEIATAAKLEAEERKVSASLAKDEECLIWENEIKEAEEELRQLSMHIASAKELEEKLEAATGLLEKLNAELEVYMEKLNLEKDGVDNEEEERKKQEILDSKTKELKEVKTQIEKVQEEVDVLQVEVSSLKTELEKKKIELAELQQKEELASVAIPSVKAEIEKTQEQIDACIEKEKEAKGKIDELLSIIEEATLEAKKSKSIAQEAEDQLNKAKAENEPVLVGLKTAEMNNNATMKGIEASKMSTKIALASIKGLQESEMDSSSEKVTISFDEYFGLSKQGHEAAEQAEERVDIVAAEIETAKESANNSYSILYKVKSELDAKKKVLHETEQKSKRAAQSAEQELNHLKEMSEEQRNSAEVLKPVDEAKTEVIGSDVATDGDTEADEDYKQQVKIDEVVNGMPTTGEPNKGMFDRSNLDDSLDESNGCCLSESRSFRSDDGEMTEYSSTADSPMMARKKKRSFFRKFWAKRKAQSVAA